MSRSAEEKEPEPEALKNLREKLGFKAMMIKSTEEQKEEGKRRRALLRSSKEEIADKLYLAAGKPSLELKYIINILKSHTLLIRFGSEIIEKIIVNTQGKRGSALSMAVENGDLDAARALLEAGADINLPILNSRTLPRGTKLLHLAAKNGYLDIVKLLLSYGVNIDERDGLGFTALYYATSHEKEEMRAFLAAKGAKVDKWNHVKTHEDPYRGNGALFLAINDRNYDEKTVDTLLEDLVKQEVDLNARINGHSALHLAAARGNKSAVNSLLKYGADVHRRDIRGLTALHYSAHTEKNYETTEILEKSGLKRDKWVEANIFKNGAENIPTLAMLAVCDNSYDPEATKEILEELQRCRINLDFEVNGENALLMACAGGNLDAVKKLMEAGADAGYLNKYEVTPLFTACFAGNADMVIEIIHRTQYDSLGRLLRNSKMTGLKTMKPGGPIEKLFRNIARSDHDYAAEVFDVLMEVNPAIEKIIGIRAAAEVEAEIAAAAREAARAAAAEVEAEIAADDAGYIDVEPAGADVEPAGDGNYGAPAPVAEGPRASNVGTPETRCCGLLSR